MTSIPQHKVKSTFLTAHVPKVMMIINIIMALVYFYIITFFFPEGNRFLYILLILGEAFHLWQVLGFIHTIWYTETKFPHDPNHTPSVDVFITVAGEPTDIVKETLVASLAMEYPNFKVYILNDGYVAKKDNYMEVEMLTKEIGGTCITRRVGGGAKAGNINNAVTETSGELIAIFDADHVPHSDFLAKMVGYFIDPKVGFVQSPQYYKNFRLNFVTRGSWEQQELFFGPICKGKNRTNSATMCGTNMVISRKALREVGGMCTDSIAEDFATGLFMHEKGWRSIYVSEVLAEGLAPEDFLSYYKQQFRWARGALDVIFKYNPIFKGGLRFSQKLQYLFSASFYLSGSVIAMNALLPVVFFLTGEKPFVVSTMLLAAVFIPYIFITLYVLQLSTNFEFTFRSLAFSLSGFPIHIQALFAALIGRKNSFAVTSKKAIMGNYVNLVIPHIAYIALIGVGLPYAIWREGLSASIINNFAWALLYVAVFAPYITAATPFKLKAHLHHR